MATPEVHVERDQERGAGSPGVVDPEIWHLSGGWAGCEGILSVLVRRHVGSAVADGKGRRVDVGPVVQGMAVGEGRRHDEQLWCNYSS